MGRAYIHSYRCKNKGGSESEEIDRCKEPKKKQELDYTIYIPFHLSRAATAAVDLCRRPEKEGGIDGERIVDVHHIDQWILMRR